MNMVLKPKDTPVQFRIDSDSLELFQARCDHYGETVSHALRDAIRMMNNHYLKNVVGSDRRPSEAVSTSGGAEVPSTPEKPPVGPVRQPQSLSERRKAEKAAKEARKARKEDRY